MITKLRRSINDTDNTYSDDILCGYISDAVDELEIGEMVRNRQVIDGDFVSGSTNIKIPLRDQTVYLIKAQIIYTEAMIHSADRDTLSYTKNKLSVDTSEQAGNHRETLKILGKKLHKALYYANGGADIEGVVIL